MNRIFEEMTRAAVLPPQEVAAATQTATSFVDVSGTGEVEFLISTGALAGGEKLTVELHASAAADGTGSVKIGEAVFTASSAMTAAVAVVSYRPAAANGRYVGVKFKHDAAAAVVCGATACARAGYLPAASGWTLAV